MNFVTGFEFFTSGEHFSHLNSYLQGMKNMTLGPLFLLRNQ